MLKRFLLIVVFLFAALVFQGAKAEDTPPPATNPVITKAKIRGDGMLVGDDGLIIGIRNMKDERASDYDLYYYGVSPEGDITSYSMYKVYQNPDTTTPDFLQETLIDIPEDNSAIIEKSKLATNTLLVDKDKIYFNGEVIASGSVAEGGIVTLVDGSLYYNGEEVPSGTVVSNGKIVQMVR